MRFSIRGVFAITTVIAIALGYWVYFNSYVLPRAKAKVEAIKQQK